MQEATPSDSRADAFQLSLRVRHPSMDPAEISRTFNIEPEHSFRAGGPRSSSTGVASASVHSESYWLGVLKPTSRLAELPGLSQPADHWTKVAQRQIAVATRSLGWALSLSTSLFLGTHADVLRRIRSEGGEVTLLVTVASGDVGSFTLAPEASRILGDLGIAVEFELASE